MIHDTRVKLMKAKSVMILKFIKGEQNFNIDPSVKANVLTNMVPLKSNHEAVITV